MPALNKRQRKNIKRLRAIDKDPNQQLTAQQKVKYDLLTGIRKTNKADPINKPGSVYDADVNASLAKAGVQTGFQNPNVTGPTGGQTTTMNDDGTISVDRTLSKNQGDILAGGEANTISGIGKAGDLIGGYNKFNFDSRAAGRDSIEDAVYKRLTKNFDRDQGREMEAAKQSLYNKGIPFSADPESRYQKELGVIRERYDDRKESARGQAVMMGGQEMQNSYNIAQGTHQQGLTDIGTLESAGSGLLMPNFDPYNAASYNPADPSAYIYKGEGLKDIDEELRLKEKAIDTDAGIANKQLAAAAAARNGGGAPAPPPFP